MTSKQKRLSTIILLLGIAGLSLSVISLYHYTKLRFGFATGPSFCNINAALNCDAVNKSEWATIFGIPLASYGASFFAAMILFSLVAGAESLVPFAVFRGVSLFISLLGSVFSIVLFFISEYAIGSLCLLCLGVYLVNFAMLAASILVSDGLSVNASLKKGMLSLFTAPRYLFGGSGADSHSSLLRAALFVSIPVLLLSVALSDFFLTRFFVQVKDPKQQIAESVIRWQRQSVTELPIVSDGSNRDYIAGPATAAIKLLEFSDFECPACRGFYTRIEPLLEKYKGKVQVAFKNYPLDSSCNLYVGRNLHPNACFAAYFARCAGEQGKFWEAADFLFKLESLRGDGDVNEINNDILKGAELFSLDSAALDECIKSDRTKTKIQSDITDGNRLKIPGTPTVWINGRLLNSSSVDEIEAIFETILKSPAH